MPVIVVVGGQWGDEGKGRIVDLLAQKAHMVARYSAGANAGHTVVNEAGELAFHLVPAGIFYPDKVCVIGNGVVVDPTGLLKEIEGLESRGISVKGRLFLSDRSQVLMPWHPLIDRLDEELRGDGAIGTTGRGVGPAFVDKVGRAGVRVADLLDSESLLQLLSFLVPYKNAVLTKLYGADALSLESVHAGTYEYVTSSVPSSLAGGAAVGIGIGPTKIDSVLGVYKAYNTRVGNGPMPTELLDERSEKHT